MRYSVSLIAFLMPIFCLAAEIRISSQEEFNQLDQIIKRELSQGERNINIHLSPGHYYFHENHVSLLGIKKKDAAISIKGDHAVLTGSGERGVFDLNAGYVDIRNQTAIPAFRELKNALGIVEFLDKESGLCRMRVNEKAVKKGKVNNMYILITQMYLGKYYPVRDISDGYVYFYAPGADGSAAAHPSKNPNCDYTFGKVLPRYALLNNPSSKGLRVTGKGKIRQPSGSRIIRCDAGCFLNMKACELGAVRVSGITFLGSGGNAPLLYTLNSSAVSGFSFTNCIFDGIKGDVLRITASSNVTFENNTVRNCHTNGIVSTGTSSKTVIRKCRFHNCGTDVSQYFCVICRGSEFIVADNIFEDFVYSAIGVGVWYKSDDPQICSGIVENNECSLSPSYNSGVYGNLMDSGAIYTWTINKDVTIRGNYIHDISGPLGNRGIFCDDGTVNVKLIGNRVERISNSYCIDLRRVLSVETQSGSKIKKVNVGNVMKDNIVDGKVRFEQRGK